ARGTGDRLRRLDRTIDRGTPALRDSHQRTLRRSDEDQAAARPGTRGRAARRLRSGTHPARRHVDPRHPVALRADPLTTGRPMVLVALSPAAPITPLLPACR